MLSRFGILFFQVVLCFPDLGFHFSEWFYAFPIWDFIFPSGFMLSRFGISFFQVVLCRPDLGFYFSKWFYAVLIWDFIFPSGFVFSRFGISFFQMVLYRPKLGCSYVVKDLKKGECVKINYGGRNGHEGRVETIQHSTVSGQYRSAVFYTECAFEKRFYKVSPCSEYNNNQRQT